MTIGVHRFTGRSCGKVVVGFEVSDMRESRPHVTRASRDSCVLFPTASIKDLRQNVIRLRALHRPRVSLIASLVICVLMSPALALAQGSPWERAASNLEFTFTGPLARSLALVSIVIGGLMFMFGEGGAKRQISGIVFGGGLALFAAQFMTWLF